MTSPHIPVLKDEVLELFSPLTSGTLIDCTLGFGGHTQALLNAHPNLKIIGIDQDKEAREYCSIHLSEFIKAKRLTILEGNFATKITEALAHQPIVGILADIGVSSLQLDNPNRGFGFHSSTLDMRMNQNSLLKASEVINSYPKSELERIFRDYGEIKEYKKMASLICEQRKKEDFHSAEELSCFLQKHFSKHKIHPATLAFQAIRIEVNQELCVLEELLQTLSNATIPHCIVGIISFHSLEDRIIKNTFKQWEQSCICDSNAYKCECGNNHNRGKILYKKPITATQEEIRFNPRSRSAKLRGFQFLG